MNYQEIADKALELLKDDGDWEQRYFGYGEEIAKNEKYVKAVCSCFRPKAPLTKYLSIGRVKDAKNGVEIDIRIMGNSIAAITVKTDKSLREHAEKGEDIVENIQKAAVITFKKTGLNRIKGKLPKEIQGELDEYIEETGSLEWDSPKLKKFRSLMKALNNKNEFDISEEHTVETLFLHELNKSSSTDKYLPYIKPCQICGQYYQLVTPLAASQAKKDILDISQQGGGIDILARHKRGNKSIICVIELKDKYEKSESPEKAIKQAIAYAAFIIKLIRSKKTNGEWWYNEIFGVGEKLEDDKPIKVYAVAAMPYQNENGEIPREDTDFIKKGPVKVGIDEIHLHYIYFKKEALKNPGIPKGFTCSFIESQF